MQEIKRPDIIQQIKGWILPFVLLFFVLFFLTYVTVYPLLLPLVWAMLLAFICYPVYRRLLQHKFFNTYPSVGAFVLTLMVIALIVVPMLSIGIIISSEVLDLFGRMFDMVGGFTPGKNITLENLLPEVIVKKLIPLFEDFPFLKDGLQQAASWTTSTLVGLARSFLASTLSILYQQIIIYVVFFFALRDGHLILDYIKDIVPLRREDREKFMERAGTVLRAVVFGIIVTAGVQGCLGAIGWWFVDLPSPFLAGGLMALLAMIPFVGTPVVWIPGSVYLFLSGNTKGCIILLVWGVGVVSMIDNFLKPYFISEKANLSTLLIFLGAFGGLASWGFLGLFLGPLILSLFVFFLDYYRNAWGAYQERYKMF